MSLTKVSLLSGCLLVGGCCCDDVKNIRDHHLATTFVGTWGVGVLPGDADAPNTESPFDDGDVFKISMALGKGYLHPSATMIGRPEWSAYADNPVELEVVEATPEVQPGIEYLPVQLCNTVVFGTEERVIQVHVAPTNAGGNTKHLYVEDHSTAEASCDNDFEDINHGQAHAWL